MKIYWSPYDIPELACLPAKQARKLWRASTFNNGESVLWPIGLALCIQSLKRIMGHSAQFPDLLEIAAGYFIGFQIQVALLRLKIYEY